MEELSSSRLDWKANIHCKAAKTQRSRQENLLVEKRFFA